MRALILIAPRCPPCASRARQLQDELAWRNFDARVEEADGARELDVSDESLVVLAFPALVLPGLAIPLGSARALLDSLRGLSGIQLAMLAISPLGLKARLTSFGRQAEDRGAQLVAIRTIPPAGPRGGIIDLAAECMSRVTGR